jgi:predicted GNAT family acetyltransferase
MGLNNAVIIDHEKLPTETKIEAHCFITSTLLKSLYNNSDFREMNKNDYYKQMNILVNMLLDVCKVKVVVDKDDMNYFYGYLVYKDIDELTTKVYYTYVKFPYRREGLASSLIEKYCGDKQILYTFRTEALKRWIERGKNDGRFRIKYVDKV